MVLILAREHHWTQAQSIAHLRDQVRTRMEQFLMLEACLPELCDVFGLSDSDRVRMEKYRTDGLRALIRGAYDWHRRSGRYAGQLLAEQE
jgi:pentalenene synthase